jgi:precorrin-6Y C5,15-methyltransferase (decarboxylating)
MQKSKVPPFAEKRTIDVIGMGLGPDDLTAKHREIIDQADVLVGGRRLLGFFPDGSAEKKPIGKDLDEVIDFIRRRMGRRSVVVLASGDPLFFGFGARLVDAFGPNRVRIHPNVSSVAAAFARIKEPWGGVRVFSLHGREPEAALLQALREDDRIAVLTDPERSPAWLARLILDRQDGGFRMAVMQALGTAAERQGWYTLEQAASLKFAEPNVVVLKRELEPIATRRPLRLGTPDEWFEHRKGLITKSEVRAVALAKLQLGPGHVLWDLGAGSGSVAIEASLLTGNGRIVAVEKNPQRIEQVKTNARRFGVRRLSVVQAELPEGLKGLPKPDRIFIGGGGKDLLPILSEAIRHLRPDGIVVINAVLLQNVHAAEAALRRLGFATEMVAVQIHRSQPMPYGERLEALNPVWIITAVRKAEKGIRRVEGGRRKK